MDRATWLADRLAAVVAAYDAEAADYDQHEYPSATQREWVARLMRQLPPESMVLDAPCGTGKYFPIIAAAGHRVVGIDQSGGMLDQARARRIATSLDRLALQDLGYRDQFEAVLTIDAMENVPPEDWPRVLANVHGALHPGGFVYMTVEEIDASAIDAAFDALVCRGMPACAARWWKATWPATTTIRAATRSCSGSRPSSWTFSTRTSSGPTVGAIVTSCCAIDAEVAVENS